MSRFILHIFIISLGGNTYRKRSTVQRVSDPDFLVGSLLVGLLATLRFRQKSGTFPDDGNVTSIPPSGLALFSSSTGTG